MKIETKYSVGQLVWTRFLQQPVQVTINSIQVEAHEQKEFTEATIIYELDNADILLYRIEEDVYDSEEAAARGEDPHTIHVTPVSENP